jgi:hypothetical protein
MALLRNLALLENAPVVVARLGLAKHLLSALLPVLAARAVGVDAQNLLVRFESEVVLLESFESAGLTEDGLRFRLRRRVDIVVEEVENGGRVAVSRGEGVEVKVGLRALDEEEKLLLVGRRGGETVRVGLDCEKVLLLFKERVPVRLVIEGGREDGSRARENPLDLRKKRVAGLEEDGVRGRVDADHGVATILAHLEERLLDGEDLPAREESVEVGSVFDAVEGEVVNTEVLATIRRWMSVRSK